MTTLIEKYKGSYNGSLNGIPEVTVKVIKREITLEEALWDWYVLTDFEQKELKMIEMFKTANIMKNALWDSIDDINQNRIALNAMDVAIWLMEELWLTFEDIF